MFDRQNGILLRYGLSNLQAGDLNHHRTSISFVTPDISYLRYVVHLKIIILCPYRSAKSFNMHVPHMVGSVMHLVLYRRQRMAQQTAMWSVRSAQFMTLNRNKEIPNTQGQLGRNGARLKKRIHPGRFTAGTWEYGPPGRGKWSSKSSFWGATWIFGGCNLNGCFTFFSVFRYSKTSWSSETKSTTLPWQNGCYTIPSNHVPSAKCAPGKPQWVACLILYKCQSLLCQSFLLKEGNAFQRESHLQCIQEEHLVN